MTFVVGDFLTFFYAIIVEAFPFVMIGTIISVLVGIFVSEDWIFRRLPKNRFFRHTLLSLLGVFIPVCECGNVPVARRLLSKGFSVSEATTFLLAAPIVNPIVFFSTLEAFKLEPSIAIVRVLSALLISLGIGLLLSYQKNTRTYLTETFIESCDHNHDHEKGQTKMLKGLTIFREEFLTVTKMLVFGAAIASITQVLIPREIIVGIGSNPFLSVVAMIVLAFVVSICSNVDAFFALAYANTFTSGAILSFLTFGPMIDIKILAMLKTTFTTKFLTRISVLVALLSAIVGLLYNLFS